MNSATTTLIIIAAVGVYFLPTTIALWTRHSHPWILGSLNLATGWTGWGWVAAFIWSIPIGASLPITVNVQISTNDGGDDKRRPLPKDPRLTPKHEPEVTEAMKRNARKRSQRA